MKRVILLSVTLMFVFPAIFSFAGGIDRTACSASKPKCGTTAGYGENTVFQKASSNISTWDRTAPEAKAMSLRGKKGELTKRRKAQRYMIF